jgi:hypothetical protein
MERKPSSINSKKESKLTRRRILKYLTAAGMAPSAAANITVDDVKAADSDQVPISIDVDGEIIEHVPADWYDRVVHTRDVRDKLARNHGRKESILAIGYDPATRDRGQPAVKIHFEREHKNKEQDQKEVPDKRDGVPIEKEERQPPKPTACTEYETCIEYDCRPLPEGTNIPAGGLFEVRWLGESSGWGSHTSRMMDQNAEYNSCWMFCAHQAVGCNDAGEIYHQPKNGGGYKVDEVVEINPYYDMAIIEPTRGVEDDILPSPYVHESSDLQDGDRYGPIENTMHEDGVAKWADEGREVFRYGAKTCYSDGVIGGLYENYSVDDENSNYCASEIREVVETNGESDDGDSGSLMWGYYEPDDAYLGIAMNFSGSPGGIIEPSYALGTAGYRIYQDLGYYWK